MPHLFHVNCTRDGENILIFLLDIC